MTKRKDDEGGNVVQLAVPAGTRTPEERRKAARSRKVASTEKQQKALELRRAGATYEAIGMAIGLSKSQAWAVVQAALTDMAEEIRAEAELVREIELNRLDRLQLGLWPRATEGDARAVEAVLRIMQHRARLLGLDLPQVAAGESSYEVVVRYTETWRSD